MAYATQADLQQYIGAGLPLPDEAEAARLLERASELVDETCLLGVDPANPRHAEAARTAVCAQVEYWLQQGEDVDVTGPVLSYSIGSMSINYGVGGTQMGSDVLAQRARRVLFRAGLLYRGVRIRS